MILRLKVGGKESEPGKENAEEMSFLVPELAFASFVRQNWVTWTEKGWKYSVHFNTYYNMSQAWWHIPVIPAITELRQKDWKLEARLGYTVRPCVKNQN